MHLQIVFLHHQTGPHGIEQFVFAHHRIVPLNQRHQHIKRPRTESGGLTVNEQLSG